MGTRQIVVVGSANVDLVLDVDHRPLGGETILGSDIVTTPGGKGANQAVAAGKLGGSVAFIGCIGADAHGELLRASLTDAGVDLSGLRTVAAPTGNAIIIVTPDGENAIIVSPAANRHVSPEMIDELEPLWGPAALLVVQLEIPLETVSHVVSRASAAGTRVVVNAAPAAALPREVLAVCDPLVVNETEAAVLLGHAAPDAELLLNDGRAEELARDLLGLGTRSVVVTLGSAGAVLIDPRIDAHRLRPVHVPARQVTAVDSTGAGDAFVGALAVELEAGSDLESAVRRATDVAAFAVSRRGAQESYPTHVELEAP